MPEMHFRIRWPDGARETCYSPSLIVKEYFTPGETYALQQFLRHSRSALTIASDRVREKYGMSCSRALDQLARIEAAGQSFAQIADACVSIEAFED